MRNAGEQLALVNRLFTRQEIDRQMNQANKEQNNKWQRWGISIAVGSCILGGIQWYAYNQRPKTAQVDTNFLFDIYLPHLFLPNAIATLATVATSDWVRSRQEQKMQTIVNTPTPVEFTATPPAIAPPHAKYEARISEIERSVNDVLNKQAQLLEHLSNQAHVQDSILRTPSVAVETNGNNQTYFDNL